MALQLSLAMSSVGIAFPAAYARVTTVSGDKNQANVMVEIHATEAARQAGARPVETRFHTFPMPATSPLYPAIYGALKLLPEYSGAVDC
jgi:hypothetical protein